MEVIKDKKVIIRKEHQCSLCLRKFLIGTEMHIQTVSNDSSLYNIYTCLTCEEILEFIESDCFDNYYPEGYVLDEMSEYNYNGTVEGFLSFLKCLKLNKR